MRFSNIEHEALLALLGESEEGLVKFIHDYLGAPAGIYVTQHSLNWSQLYNYIGLHMHLVSDSDLTEYIDETSS
jgi:hypothetical protein